MLPSVSKAYNTRTNNNIPHHDAKHNLFRNSFFFSSTVIKWNILELNIRNSERFSAFNKSLLKFIRPSSNSTFKCHSLNGIKLPDLGSALLNSVITNLGTIFRILLPQVAYVVMTSRLRFIIYFIV